MDPSPEVGKKIIEKPPSTAVDESGSDDETDTIEMEGRTVSAKGQQVYVFFFLVEKIYLYGCSQSSTGICRIFNFALHGRSRPNKIVILYGSRHSSTVIHYCINSTSDDKGENK